MGETRDEERAKSEGVISANEPCDVTPETSARWGVEDTGKSIESDLYCLKCGYNLRGLSGDPVRCPECGFLNPVEIAEIPAEAIKRQLKRMETAPALSAAVTAILVCLCIPPIMSYRERGGIDSNVVACSLLPFLVFCVVWIFTVDSFCKACQERPGWLFLLVRYQVVALAMMAATAGIIIGSVGLLDQFHNHDNAIVMLCLGGGFVTILVVFYGVFRPIHRWLKQPMEKMQRQAAVEIAKREIREKMTKRRTWGRSA